jgi:hypothetical protein
LHAWKKHSFRAPSPARIKKGILLGYGAPDATWIETGTLYGGTTHFLSKHAKFVYSIEPAPILFAKAKSNFEDYGNVEIINGTSEEALPALLPKIDGNVNFWLDGHYSAGITFKGSKETPIAEELRCIENNLNHFGKVCIFVDDVRCFGSKEPEFAAYPPLDFLTEWARKNNMEWHIEQDIFFACR